LFFVVCFFFFFFQAENGIRSLTGTGGQTCALPILQSGGKPLFVAKCCNKQHCPTKPPLFRRCLGECASCNHHEGDMTTFDKREEGFEKKFALDEEQRFKAMARRNKLLGLWAAGQLGLSGPAADAYSKEVVAADFEEP